MGANLFLFVTDYIGRNGPEESVHVNDWSAQVYMKLGQLFDQKIKMLLAVVYLLDVSPLIT